MSQPNITAPALRILDQLEAAYARQAPQPEIDALWQEYHDKERPVLWLLEGAERMCRTLDRLAAKGARHGSL